VPLVAALAWGAVGGRENRVRRHRRTGIHGYNNAMWIAEKSRVKALLFVLATAIAASGCSGDKATPPQSKTSSEEIVKRDCADPKWKEQNLGLWYSVCRQPLRW